MTRQTWMVRAGREGRFFDDFRDRSFVAIGWAAVGDLSGASSRAEVVEMVRAAYPEERDQSIYTSAGQLYRFLNDFTEGDRVVTYDPRARRYLRGHIAGPYSYYPDTNEEEFSNQRKAVWESEVPRDELSPTARNTLGSTLTIFSIPPEVSAELWSERIELADLRRQDGEAAQDEEAAPSAFTDEQMVAQASEAIKDRIAQLSWQDMQELIAGLLRAMGYKTTVSPAGSDRGKDIVASPDGFGFQEPRIVVEVKHRRSERMGSQEIRGFLGGRHAKDKGLYVSTGGFSKEAYYEAERSTIQLTLLDFEGLVEAILEHYANFDEITKQILPLRRLYWPVSR